MKNLLIILLLTVASTSYGQSSELFFKALKNKDTNTINTFLSSDVDLCIGSYQDYLSQSEALLKIKTFLAEENPTKVEQIHNGKSDKSGSNYNVAKMTGASGVHRVFIYFEKGSINKISELRFDK